MTTNPLLNQRPGPGNNPVGKVAPTSQAGAFAKAFAPRPGAVITRAGGAAPMEDGASDGGSHAHSDLASRLDGHDGRLDDHDGRLQRLEHGHADDGTHGGGGS